MLLAESEKATISQHVPVSAISGQHVINARQEKFQLVVSAARAQRRIMLVGRVVIASSMPLNLYMAVDTKLQILQ